MVSDTKRNQMGLEDSQVSFSRKPSDFLHWPEIKIRVLVLNVHRKQCILERKGAFKKKGTVFTNDI